MGIVLSCKMDIWGESISPWNAKNESIFFVCKQSLWVHPLLPLMVQSLQTSATSGRIPYPLDYNNSSFSVILWHHLLSSQLIIIILCFGISWWLPFLRLRLMLLWIRDWFQARWWMISEPIRRSEACRELVIGRKK